MCWKRNNNNQDKVIVAEFNVSLYCDGCEELVAETISKVKGVEKYITNMITHKVVVMGKINPRKVLKKLKKTGKRVELILTYEHVPDDEEQRDVEEEDVWEPAPDPLMYEGLGENSMYTILSDENPNACSIM